MRYYVTYDLKKYLCLLLAVVLIVHSAGVVGVSDEVLADYAETFEDTDVQKLDISWADEADAYGVIPVYDNGKMYAIKTWVSATHPVRITHSLDTPIDSGLYYISFDWKSVDGSNDCFLRFLSENSQYQICGFRNDGKFGRFIDYTKWALESDTEVDYLPNQWYTVGVLFDFDLRDIYIYLGEKGGMLSLIEKSGMTDDMTGFTDMVLVHSYGDYPPAMWDDIRIYKLNSEKADLLENQENIVFDENVTKELLCVPTTENKGNIFYNAETAEVNVRFYNRSDTYMIKDIRCDVLYNGQCIYSEKVSIAVEPGEKSDYTITVPTDGRYGFYTFRVLSDDHSEAVTETRFSNARTAADGVKNSKLGATVHMTRVKDKEASFEILKNGGFASVRGGKNDWQEVENEKGKYITTEENTAFYSFAEDEDFEVMTILKGSNSLYAEEFPTSNTDREGEVENPPQSDGLIERFAEYCFQTVVMYPQVKYFQVWNEWNNAPTFNNDRVTDAASYAKLLKEAYYAVKRGAETRGREAMVVAMAPSGTKPEWIGEVLDALEGEKCFDIISVHPYTYIDGGENGASTYAPEDICVRHVKESGNIVTRLENVYKTLDDYGYSDVPVWAGEFGFSSYLCGEEQQAQYAVRMMALCDGNELLDKMMWYTFQNHTEIDETQQNYGIIRYDENVLVPYEAKPMYIAMSSYNALMAEAEPVRKISDGSDGVYAYEFTARDGDSIYTVWTTNGEKEVMLDVDAKLVRLYDLYGNEIPVLTQDGSVIFTADESMTYVKVSDTYVSILQNEKLIDRINEITDDAYIIAEAKGYDSFRMIVAQYSNDTLLDVKLHIGGEEPVSIGKVEDAADRIDIFMWNGLLPIYDKVIIE